MTVRDLIAILQTYNPEAQVLKGVLIDCGTGPIKVNVSAIHEVKANNDYLDLDGTVEVW